VTEFVTEYRSSGGIASHLDRVAGTLHDLGHEVEIFVPSENKPGDLDRNGVRVERVHQYPAFIYRTLHRFFWGVLKRRPPTALTDLLGALGFARALRRRRREVDFDAIFSFDFGLPARQGELSTRCVLVALLYGLICCGAYPVAKVSDRVFLASIGVFWRFGYHLALGHRRGWGWRSTRESAP